MRNLISIILLITITLLLSIHSCEKIVYTYDDTDPNITSSPAILSVTDSTCTIYWETDEACHVNIEYGVTTEYDSIYEDDENRQYHEITLTDLTPYTLYNYKIYNWDFAGNGPVVSDDLSFTTLHNEYSYLREDWIEYTNKDYDGAVELIYQSYNLNPDLPETIASIGWFQLRLDSLDAARNSFQDAHLINQYLNITLAGMAVLSMIDNLPEQAIQYGTGIINSDPEWSFEYCNSMSHLQVRIILAEAYIQTQQIEKAQSELDIVWPDNGLDPNNPDTWIISDESYGTYEEALIAAINYIANNMEEDLQKYV